MKRIHPKVTGAGIAALISAFVIAELSRRFHIQLLTEEIGVLEAISAFIGGYIVGDSSVVVAPADRPPTPHG